MEDKLKNFKPLSELLDSVRNIDGFPIGEDKDILALSDAPYYTACPNPYINDFIEAYGTPYDEATDTYERKPFSEDVSEGKGDPIYNVHTYHTKVPPKAIKAFVDYYTEKDDIVFDGFSGSGMTGVATQMCGRKAILSDISTAATFIESNYNCISNDKLYTFKMKANEILEDLKKEIGWMYETSHEEEKGTLYEKKGLINYTVWSDIIYCPYCKNEIILYEKNNESSILEEIKVCYHCKGELGKKYNKVMETKYDSVLRKKVEIAKQIPLFINYTYEGKKYEKKLDEMDFGVLKKIEEHEIPYWYPIYELYVGANTNQPIQSHNFKYVHQMYTKRNLWSSAYLYNKIIQVNDIELKRLLMFWFTSLCVGQTKMNRYFESSFSQVNRYLKGTLYIGKKTAEVNPIYSHKNKIDVIYKNLSYSKTKCLVSLNSATEVPIKKNSIDYIFTDPPFGDNIMYSELNIIWESWLKLKTNENKEAIINKFQDKALIDYSDLMYKSFSEFYRILKPNRWITVVFHNSKASVWNAIQHSLSKAGFIVAQVTVLDKQQETFKQMTAPGSAKNDLIINAYKPQGKFEERFLKTAGEGMEVEFVKQQFNHLPIEPNIERTEQMLYSKMLAHYVENGFKIEYNAINFYELLENNFVELDGYWFDESEVLRYNEWKSKQGNLDKIKELKNTGMILFINNEKTALQWIYQFLNEPRSYSDILTNYNMIVDSKSKDEIPELREMLDNNFFTEEGKYRRPYTKDERKQLKKHREKELEKAWEKLLERAKNEKNKMKTVRKEALEYGFKKCYDEENYQDIILVGKKLHDSILEENSDITEFIEIAEIKLDI